MKSRVISTQHGFSNKALSTKICTGINTALSGRVWSFYDLYLTRNFPLPFTPRAIPVTLPSFKSLNSMGNVFECLKKASAFVPHCRSSILSVTMKIKKLNKTKTMSNVTLKILLGFSLANENWSSHRTQRDKWQAARARGSALWARRRAPPYATPYWCSTEVWGRCCKWRGISFGFFFFCNIYFVAIRP